MPSDFEAEFETYALPDLVSEFGRDVSRWPDGDSESAVTVSDAIFDERRPEVSRDRGKALQRKALLLAPEGQTVKKSDAWSIDGETWQCESIGRSSGGMREVHLVRTERPKTKPKTTSNKETHTTW